jgi:hypothetical protein
VHQQLLRGVPSDSTAVFDLRLSSNTFRCVDRNLNTGGKNYDESHGVAHNPDHHSKQYPSELKITVVKK